MRTKLILFLIVLAGILILANWLAGRHLSSKVDQQLRIIAESQESVSYDYQSLHINPALGAITIEKLSFEDDESILYTENIRGSLPYADIWRVLRQGGEAPADQIRSFRLNTRSISLHSKNSDNGPDGDNMGQTSFSAQPITLRSLDIVYNGKLDQVSGMFTGDKPPEANHRINISANDLSSDGEIPEHIGSVPILAGYHFPGQIDQLNLQIRYLAEEQTAQITSMKLVAPNATFRAGGTLRYDEQGWPDTPANIELHYDLNAKTKDIARLPLSDAIGGFSMDSLSISSSIETDMASMLTDRHPLTIPGETSLYLSNIHWYPASRLTEQYGMLFNMLAVNGQRLPLRSLQADYQNTRDTLRVREAVFRTEPFDALLRATVLMPTEQRPEIVDGSLTFIRTSADFNDFVDGIEGLFQLELPRRDGRLHLPFRGDPASPDFDLNLP